MRALLLGITLIAQLASIDASAATAASLTPQQLKSIRALIQATLDKHKAPGASFAIAIDSRIAWSEGFGYADVENQVRATPQTAYRSASIGKSMTATAAMQLAEQGKLDLSAPIQKYCPSFPEKPWPITAMHLITHTSGIRHYEGPNVDAESFNLRHFEHVSDALA